MFGFILIVLVILLFAGVPIAQALGIESFIYMIHSDIAANAIPQKFFSGIDSFTMLAIPGFMLAGNLMSNGGITERIVGFCKRLSGEIRGGLSIANIVASMVFAGISGSATGDTASIGGILIPAQKKEGYTPEHAVGVTAASSCLAPLIPPSIPMIVAGGCASLSVGRLFIAGAIPGILMGVGQIGLVLYLAYRYKYPKGIKCSLVEVLRSAVDAFWSLLMVVIILVSILSGLCTPTEASIIAVVYGWIIGTFVYKELKIRDIPKLILDSMLQATAVLAITGFAAGFAWVLAREQIPTVIANSITSVTTNKYIFLLMVNLLLIFVGMFMETLSALLILLPVLLPVATSVFAIDPIQFTTMSVLNLVIGLVTPPVGVCLATACGIGKISLSRGVKGILPFYIVSISILVLVTLIPGLTTWLPGLIYN